MDPSHIIQLVIAYRYWILVPLSFLEGPIIAFIAGTLASAGYFNIYILAVFFLFRDVIVDLACYSLGFFGGQAAWVRRLIARMGVTQGHLDEVRSLWHTHPFKTMFLSKLSYGVASGFIVVAGLVRMSLEKFMLYGIMVTFLHYGTLLALGYFFGASLGGTITGILEKVPYVVGGLSLLIIGYYLLKRYMNTQLTHAEEETHASE
jgi:membrane protein DedA with SNARE-associated domain